MVPRKEIAVVEYPQLKETSCPYCGIPSDALSFAINKWEVSWDDENRQFVVNMAFDVLCPGDGSEWTENKVVSQIPVIIAERSHCSCGGDLILKDYILGKKEGLAEFRGTYTCEACHQAQNTLLRRIGKGLSSIWRETKKIEVGPKGVSCEKEANSKNAAQPRR